jgi:hypothetical protein
MHDENSSFLRELLRAFSLATSYWCSFLVVSFLVAQKIVCLDSFPDFQAKFLVYAAFTLLIHGWLYNLFKVLSRMVDSLFKI